MKKLIPLITLALLLSCAKETEQPVQYVQGVKTYTITVKAGKGERTDTKALILNGEALEASWTVGEEVTVINNTISMPLGTITAQTPGKTTTLSGSIQDIYIYPGTPLTLKFLSPDYAAQDGTLAYIASHCDYATADVTVSSVEGGNVTTTQALFRNNQAIVKFRLADAGENKLSASPLMVSADNLTITVTPEEATDELYVAIPTLSSRSLHLAATVGDKLYVFKKDGVTLEAGKYYDLTVKMSEATLVQSETELRAALSARMDYITLGTSITLSKHLDIGYKVTIDLDGHTLQGNETPATSSGDYKCLFVVTATGDLTLKDGTLTHADNTATNSYAHGAGAIVNEGTVTLANLTITGCRGLQGGAVRNGQGARLTVGNGCQIMDNTAESQGGGIYNEGALKVEGTVSVTGNSRTGGLEDNVYLWSDTYIDADDIVPAGSSIGVSMKSPGVFTTGNEYTGKEQLSFFKADWADFQEIGLSSGCGFLSAIDSGNDVKYIKRAWDNTEAKVVSQVVTLNPEDYILLTEDHRLLVDSTTYVVKGDVTIGGLLQVECEENGNTCKLVLCDGAHLTVTDGINLGKYSMLEIYGQILDSGVLTSQPSTVNRCGIGTGSNGSTQAKLNIHGGIINARGGANAAGIGTSFDGSTSYTFLQAINIYGGTITAQGGVGAAGIGTGGMDLQYLHYGAICIYGGIVSATGGGKNGTFFGGGGAGIGGGYRNMYGKISIYGGSVTAYGGYESAGIGGGSGAPDPEYGSGDIEIFGGTVKAYGANYGAGIGGGDGGALMSFMIKGGWVEAYGGTDAAGIGGGEGGNGGTVTIEGGYVYAQGKDNGAGIGGGEDGQGGEVTINGGTVIAKAGIQGESEDYKAIGCGNGHVYLGLLRIGNKMMVQSGVGDNYEGISTTIERRNACWFYPSARIEPCTHVGATYTVSGAQVGDTHTLHCPHCSDTPSEEHTFDNQNRCIVCGVTGDPLQTVHVYVPREDGNLYDAAIDQKINRGAILTLPSPPADREPVEMEFVGWRIGSPEGLDSFVAGPQETLLPVGTSFKVDKDSSLTARYRPIDIRLAKDVSNSGILSKYNGKKAQHVALDGVTLYRDGRLNVLCLPLSIPNIEGTPLQGAVIRTLDTTYYDSSAKKLTLRFGDTPVTAIKAGEPYFVKWADTGAAVANPEFSHVDVHGAPGSVTKTIGGEAPSGASLSFIGLYAPFAIPFETKMIYYLGDDSLLHYPDGHSTATIYALSAYFITLGMPPDSIEAAEILGF